jgi:cellulose synthase (UDP-forming)
VIEIEAPRRRRYLQTCRFLALTSTVLAGVYLTWLLTRARPETVWLYWLLVAVEIFNIVQAAGFWLTISFQRWSEPSAPRFAESAESVDLFITVRGEPLEIVALTVAAATRVRHPRKQVWVLDDGDSDEVRELAERYAVGYIRREEHNGAKAGNVNHALSMTSGQYFAIFDADQAPHEDFLEGTMGAFADDRVAFVQTPQVYRNRDENRVSSGAHDQQGLFYGPILRGKNGMGSVFCCGTNVVFRRDAIDEIGGMPEDSITEDLRATLLLLHSGYRSEYVSRVLADGLGPLDVGSYFNQQYRWGRGGLDILFRHFPYSFGMSVAQVVQFTLGFIYWFTGISYLTYLVLPVSYLVFGLRPIHVPNDYPAFFVPYIGSALLTIVYATDLKLSFPALWFTLSSFPVQLKATVDTLLGRRARFVVTPKVAGRVSLRPVIPQLLTMVVLVASAAYGLAVRGVGPSVVNNVAWVVAHLVILSGFVRLTLRPDSAEKPSIAPMTDAESESSAELQEAAGA